MTHWQIVTSDDTPDLMNLLFASEHLDRISDNYTRLNWLISQTDDPVIREQLQACIDNDQVIYKLFEPTLNAAIKLKEQRDEALLDVHTWKTRAVTNAQLQITQILSERTGVGFDDMRRVIEQLTEDDTDLYASPAAENAVLNTLRQLVETNEVFYKLLLTLATDQKALNKAVHQLARELFEEEMFQSELYDDEYAYHDE